MEGDRARSTPASMQAVTQTAPGQRPRTLRPKGDRGWERQRRQGLALHLQVTGGAGEGHRLGPLATHPARQQPPSQVSQPLQPVPLATPPDQHHRDPSSRSPSTSWEAIRGIISPAHTSAVKWGNKLHHSGHQGNTQQTWLQDGNVPLIQVTTNDKTATAAH